VDFSHLRPSDTIAAYLYKGQTSAHWSVQTAEALHPDLAWSYDFTTRQLLLIAFYDKKVDVFLDGERQVRPKTHF